MVKITTEEPLNCFAEKIAERTGISRQNVAHVLAAAIVVTKEEADERREGESQDVDEAGNHSKPR